MIPHYCPQYNGTARGEYAPLAAAGTRTTNPCVGIATNTSVTTHTGDATTQLRYHRHCGTAADTRWHKSAALCSRAS